MVALDADQKKKVYVLAGLAGVLGIVGLVVLQPWNTTATDTEVTTTTDATTPPGDPASGGAPPPPGEPGAPGAAVPPPGAPAGSPITAGTAVNTPPLVAAERYRSDPFEQFYTPAVIPPPPPPTPTPIPPPVEIPPPVPIPGPGESGLGGSFGGGGFGGASQLPGLSGGTNASTAIVGLPAPRISRMSDIPSAPRVQVPPTPRSGGTTSLQRAGGNRRLSGVVIGDSVRALLETDTGTGADPTGMGGVTTRQARIVQPGDEIDGMRVLRIERFTEGDGRNRVRMVVRENGEERYIELRPSPQPITGPAGGPEAGFPGGFPGAGRPPFGPGGPPF